MMLKFARAVGTDEVIVGGWGQSNARPWGTKTEGFSEIGTLQLPSNGINVTISAMSSTAVGAGVTVTLSGVTLDADDWIGAELRFGTTAAPQPGYAIVTGNTAGVLTVTIVYAVAGTHTAGYLTFADDRWKTYPNVRVLTPYLPDQGGAYPNVKILVDLSANTVKWPAHDCVTGDEITFSGTSLPGGLTAGVTYYAINNSADAIKVASSRANAIAGTAITLTSYGFNTKVNRAPYAPGDDYTVPASVTKHEDFGLFLPFTFLEGIEGFGISEASDGTAAPTTHAATDATDTTFTFANAVSATDIFANGFISVRHAGGLSWADIETNDTTTSFALKSSWRGAGTPQGTPADWKYEAWIPHYSNSPHARLIGFRYPNNDLMPGPWSTNGGKIKCRPRGVTTGSYDDRFGMILPIGTRLAILLGRRVNFVWLGVNSSGQLYRNGNNEFGFQGIWGWWDDDKYLDWTPSDPDSNAARYAKMWGMVPTALEAEGNTNGARALAIVGAQGEADALVEEGRQTYKHTLPTFYSWLIDTITAVQVNGKSLVRFGDGVRMPIVHQKIKHIPYELSGAVTYYGVQFNFDGDDESRVNTAINNFTAKWGFGSTLEVDDSPQLTLDPLHFNGVGEAINGRAIADLLGGLIDRAMSMTSNTDADVEICNLALSRIGALGAITSLDTTVDLSVEAAHCARYFHRMRDSLLSAHSWSFNTERLELIEVENTSNQWLYAYGVPGHLMRALSVIHKDATADYSVDMPVQSDIRDLPPGVSLTTPQDFVIETDTDGFLVLRTNQPEAMLRFNKRVNDASLYPPLVVEAFSWWLASALAGPIIKGEAGAAEAKRCLSMAQIALSRATPIDSNQRTVQLSPLAPWLAARG